MRFIPALLLVLPALVACSSHTDTNDTVTGHVLDVHGSDLTIEVDGKRKQMRLAGVVAPEPGECMYDDFKQQVSYRASDYDDVKVKTVGKAPDGVPLIKVDIETYDDAAQSDLATLLVEDGVAVVDAHEEDISKEMRAARDEAYKDHAGLLSDYKDCTLGAVYGEVQNQYDDIADFEPHDVDGADLIIDDLAAWILVADSFLDNARRGAHDLRLLAYSPVRLAQMLATVQTNRAAAAANLRTTKALRKKLRVKEARQAAIDKAENDRWWAQYNAEHHSSGSGSSSSGGGGGYDGYTGPRCYEPGGKTYHPC